MANNGIIAYKVSEEKLTAKSSLVFTGLVAVPPNGFPEVTHGKIVKYFNNSAQIKGVCEQEIKEIWDTLEQAILDKNLTADMMPTVAWNKLKAHQMCSREDLKSMIKKEKEKEKQEKLQESSGVKSQAFSDLKLTDTKSEDAVTKVESNLFSENAYLRNRVIVLEKTVEETKEKLQVVTMDRDKRAREAMSSGSEQVNEVYVAKQEKKEADLKIKSLEDQIESMKKIYNEKNHESLEKVQKQLAEIQLTIQSTKDEVLKTKAHAEQAVNLFGSDRDRRAKLWTPAAEKISQIQTKIVLIAKESFFRVSRTYRSLGRDMDKLINGQNLSKIVLSGGGLDMASDFHKKKNTHGGWGQDTLVVLLVDDAEIVDTSADPKTRERNLDSVASFLSSGLDAKSAKAVLLVAGPSLDDEKESGRQIIMSKIKEMNSVTLLNMSAVAKEGDTGRLDKWDNNGNFTPLSAAYLMTTLAAWANGIATNTEGKVSSDICNECGFCHEKEDKNCFKTECAEAKEKLEEELKQDKKTDRNKYDQGSYRPFLRCTNCGNKHGGPCRFANANDRRGVPNKKFRTNSPE